MDESSTYLPTPPFLAKEVDVIGAVRHINSLGFKQLTELSDRLGVDLADVESAEDLRKLLIKRVHQLPRVSLASLLESSYLEFEAKREVLAQFLESVKKHHEENAELVEQLGSRASTTGPSFYEDLRAQSTDEPPSLLTAAVEHLMRGDALSHTGIFRVEGSKEEVDHLYEMARSSSSVDFSRYHHDVIANFVKRWMRNLSEPLLTYAHYGEFIRLTSGPIDPSKLKATIDTLPNINRNILSTIMNMLHATTLHEGENKMGASNLATIWGPNLLYQREQDPLTMVDDMKRAAVVVEAIIKNHKHIFMTERGTMGSSNGPLAAAEKCIHEKHCTIVVCGDMSVGKSTFLNLMMEEDILPNAVIRCTGAICEVVAPSDPAKPKAYFYRRGEDAPSLVLPMPSCSKDAKDLLQQYTCVDSDDDVHRCVVEWNEGVVKAGIRLVDTPGLNDRKRLDMRVKEYLPSAIAMIVLLNLNAGGLTKTTKRLVRSALSMGIPARSILFVGSKVDRITGDPSSICKATKVALRKLIHARPRFAPLNVKGAFKTLEEFKVLMPGLEEFNDTLKSFVEGAFQSKLKLAHGMLYGRGGVISDWHHLAKLQLQSSVNSAKDIEFRRRRIEKALADARVKKRAILKNLHRVLHDVDVYLMNELNALLSDEKFSSQLEEYVKGVDIRGLSKKQAGEVLKGEMNHFAELFLQQELPEIFDAKREQVQTTLVESATFLQAMEKEIDFLLFSSSIRAVPTTKGNATEMLLDDLKLHPRLSRLEKGGLYHTKLRRNKKRKFCTTRKMDDFKRSGVSHFLKHVRSGSSRRYIVSQMFSSRGITSRVDCFFERLMDRHRRELDLLGGASVIDSSAVQRFWGKTDTLMEWLAAYKISNLFDWNFEFRHIEIVGSLGGGAFGDVKLVRYKGEEMAMKMMMVGRETADKAYTPFTTFDQEYQVLRELGKRKAPVVRYHGAAVSDDGCLCLLMELCRLGDVTSYIKRKSPDLRTRMGILVSAAKSLKYIHDEGYVHRDVKGGNFLLTDSLEVKAVDFGLAGHSLDVTASRGKGTPLFMAPEMIPDDISLGGYFPLATPGPKADIFSFGMVMLQVLSGSLPYSNAEGVLAIDGMKEIEFYQALHHGTLALYIPPFVSPSIRELITACVVHDPKKRPNWGVIIDTLKAELESPAPAIPRRDRSSDGAVPLRQ